MTPYRLILGLSIALGLIAGGLQFAPLKAVAQAPTETGAPAPKANLNFAAHAHRFDVSGLPDPVMPAPAAPPPPPPPDPAAGLKRYRFIGLAKSDARAAGVFERDGVVAVVAIGARLDGFTLADLNETGARFVNSEHAETQLPLVTEPAP